MRNIVKPLSSFSLAAALALFGLTACQETETSSTKADAQKTAEQAIGESVRPVWTKPEVGLGIQPDYRERLLAHLANRVRMTPTYWNLRRNPMTGQPVPSAPGANANITPYVPRPPSRYSPYMSDSSRWQAEHQLLTGCACTAEALDDDGDPMTPLPPELEARVNASCCEVSLLDGVPTCTTGLLRCDTENEAITTRQERWALLNQGVGQIVNESISNLQGRLSIRGISLNAVNMLTGGLPAPILFQGQSANSRSVMAFGLVEIKEPPDECKVVPAPCGDGVCKQVGSELTTCDKDADPNDDCLGLCVGGDEDGNPCTRPQKLGDNCKPENYPVRAQLTYTEGEAPNLPAPALSDGLHFQLAMLDDMNQPIPAGTPYPSQAAPFFKTPYEQVTFGVNYYAPNGTPIGTPTELKLILKNACVDLTKVEVPQKIAITSGMPPVNEEIDAPYGGNFFFSNQVLEEGCFPYAFTAIDGDGFGYTYPSYGSLQAQIKRVMVPQPDGTSVQVLSVVENDETCPIWVETRVDLSCAASPSECNNGDTRACYTGLIGTQDNGICKPGTETCEGGRWNGVCAGQVLPEEEDVCSDGLDNNCNGSFDDNCPDKVEPDMNMPKEDMSMTQEDMNMPQEDMATEPQEDMSQPKADMSQAGADMGSGSKQDQGFVVIDPNDNGSGGGDDDGGCGCQSTNSSPAEQGAPMLLGLLGLFFFRRARRRN